MFILVGSLVSVHRFWQYEIFYYDFGIFDRAIWSVSRFQPPIIDHLVIGEKIIFADHFSPSNFLLSPLYWFTNRSEILLIAQSFFVGMSGFVLYLIGVWILKNVWYALSIMTVYFLFVGLQNAVITDFHEVTVATFFFMLVYLFFIKQQIFWYFLSLLVFLGFKESNFLIGIGIGVSVFFLNPQWRKIALMTILLSIFWGILSIKVIIPFFSEGRYIYSTELSFNPVRVVESFIDDPRKLRTLWYSFGSFGFLPLLSPSFWLLLFQDFFVRFYPHIHPRWELGFHYSAIVAAIMGVSSLFSLRFLQQRFSRPNILHVFILVLVLNALFLYRFILRGPLALAYNPAFYAHSNDFAFLDKAIARIPDDASVMAQNNLLSRFSHQKSWLLVNSYESKQPDYIILDVRDGQNPNNHYGIANVDRLVISLKQDNQYNIYYHEADVYIFKRQK